MTLKVRIEKADATDFIAGIHEEYYNRETNSWQSTNPDADVGNVLTYPAEAKEFTIWEGKRLVITECGSNGMIYTNRSEFYSWMNRAIAAEKKLGELQLVKEEQ